MNKKCFFCILIMLVLCHLLIACKDKSNESAKKSVIVETVSGKEKNSIPDPRKAKDNVSVMLHDCSKLSEEILKDNKTKEKYLCDLSFLGFKNEVIVTQCAMGNVTGSGKNLVIAINDLDYENEYIAVLDYNRKRSYIAKTDIVCNCGKEEQINLKDITGDGIQEIIYSNEPNRALVWNMYKYDGDALKKIYSNVESAELERDGFDIGLLDNYRFIIKGKKYKYEKRCSLLDYGFNKTELEISNEREKEAYGTYRNGELVNNDFCYIELNFLEAENWKHNYADYNYFKKCNYKTGIKLPLRIVLVDKEVGKLWVCLKYDIKKEKMIIVDADFH